MIIAVDIREWRPGRRTGIGRFLEEFLRVATALRPRDLFLAIGDSTSEVRFQAVNLEVVRVSGRWTLWWDQVSLPRTIARRCAAVYFSPYIKVPLLAPVPVVSTVHDLTYFLCEEYNQRPVDRIKNALFRLFCWLVVRRAAAVLVDSSTTGEDVRRLLNLDPSRLRVIPLATSDCFRPGGDAQFETDRAVWERYGLSAGYVLYVGGFKTHKNVPHLVRAYAGLSPALRARHPLVLVGGPYPDDLQGLLFDSAVAACTKLVGVVPDEDLPSLYRGAALFTFPSRYEGFGLPVLEAMSCGVPVLCSTAPALMELGGDAVQYADPEDVTAWRSALSALLADSGRRTDLALRGKTRATAYSPSLMADQILKVLDEVAARQPTNDGGAGSP